MLLALSLLTGKDINEKYISLVRVVFAHGEFGTNFNRDQRKVQLIKVDNEVCGRIHLFV